LRILPPLPLALVFPVRRLVHHQLAPLPAHGTVVPFVRVKRNLVTPGRSYGHWWLELDETELRLLATGMPAGVLQTVRGVGGVLNGLGVHSDGTATRDPYHGLPADHEFCPLSSVTLTTTSFGRRSGGRSGR